MRFILKATLPTPYGNALIRSGEFGPTIQSILEEIKPEAAYFTEIEGERTGFIVVDIQDASEMVKVGEPFFLAFNGKLEFHPVMVMEDLMKGGAYMESAVKKWTSHSSIAES